MYDVHVVSHTHWDREWYHTAGRFRQRLVALVDELLDDPPAPGQSFLLDGQAIVVEDYLSVRPHRRAALSALLAAGRLEAGPWYVLADELIPSGEALVRNLLAGRRALRDLGADAPPVLYCPDSFGHPAALPELAAGFDLSLIILWRGYGGARWPEGDTFRFMAAGGASVLAFHLPPDGYEFGADLPTQENAARARWTAMRDLLARRSRTKVLLIQNGADHHARQRRLGEALDSLAAVAVPSEAHASSLREFASTLVDAAEGESLPVVTGELRDSYGYTWTLQGTFATRAHEKRMNALVERLLVRDVEPWVALARRMTGRSRTDLVNAAWRCVLQAHPHDTLCGCSIDAVATAMETRLADARLQGEGLRDDAVCELLRQDPEQVRHRRDEWQPHLIVRNRAARPRSGVAVLDVREFVADAPVGPSSAGQVIPRHAATNAPIPGIDGADVLQGLSRSTAYDRLESSRAYPDNDLVTVQRVIAWVREVPGYGLAALPLAHPASARSTAPNTVTAPDEHTIDNGLLRLRIGDDGALSVVGAHGTSIANVVWFEDLADEGDLYTPSVRKSAGAAAFLGARLLRAGPLRGEIIARWRIEREHAAGAAGLMAEVEVRITLDADAPFLRLLVSGVNFGSDHRLRVGIRTGVSDPDVWADAAFGPVRRAPLLVPPGDTSRETPPRTAPLHRYVSLFSGTHGATVYSDGLGEYEVTPEGDVLITLVRAVGQLSRADIPERPGHAGWPTPTPLAQCHRPFESELALFPHGSRTDQEIDRIECIADDVLLPLEGTTLRWAIDVPPDVAGVTLEGAGLAVSAIVESDDGESTVLRCLNLLDRAVDGAWRLGFEIGEARLARLDETPLSTLAIDGNRVAFTAGPRAVVTILVR